MLDDFRKQANESSLFDEDIDAPEFAPGPPPVRRHYFLGMSPAQRFMVALMLLMLVCMIGVFGLLVTEKVFVPF